jgi:hypothetical protein
VVCHIDLDDGIVVELGSMKRLLKVLKELATEIGLSLGDLLEGIVFLAFDGKAPSSRTIRI